MEPIPGLTIGESLIILRSLEVLCRGEGARYEWEKMITSLVKVDHPDARNPEAISGDQGIDVVVGRVSGGDIVVWQAKYFTRIGESQKRNIGKSFQTALDKAKERGNRLIRWVLCVPINRDIAALRWWEKWCSDNRDTGVEFVLWGESEIVQLLIRPVAADVRRYYFGGPSIPDASAPVEPLVPSPPPAQDAPWRGGDAYIEDACRHVPAIADQLAREHTDDPRTMWIDWAAERRAGLDSLRQLPNGVWRCTLPASAYGERPKVALRRLGSFEVRRQCFLQIWCDDATLRRKAVMDRGARMARVRGIDSRGAMAARVSALATQLEVPPPDLEAIRTYAERAGLVEAVDRLDQLK